MTEDRQTTKRADFGAHRPPASAVRRRWWRTPPAYCGAIEPHRILGGFVRLVWITEKLYLEVKPLGVWKRVR